MVHNANGQGRPKRLLWILNHKTLLPAEVPLLESFGFEVFVPTKAPNDPEHISGVAYHSGAQSLDMHAREVLENHSFYTDPWSAELQAVINDNFDAIITVIYHAPLQEALTHFRGPVFARVFGRESDYTYDGLFTGYGFGLTGLIKRAGARFFFAQVFSNIGEIEPTYLRERCVTVGCSLPAAVWQHADTWGQPRNELLFLCPKINAHSYYRGLYDSIKESFGDLPHKIMGGQAQPVDDEHVLGYIDDHTLFERYAKSAAFLYLSTEPRHLHYTPLEAIIVGTPVLYMRGSKLSLIAGKPLPGECDSLASMRDKAIRLLGNDRALIQEIVATQKQLLPPFMDDSIREEWFAALVRAKVIEDVKLFRNAAG